MNVWAKNELRAIAESDDLHISPFREDGKTYGTPTWIWSIVVDDALYVRAYNGQESSWYQAALRQKAGRITAAGITKEVIFEPVDGKINDRIERPIPREVQRQPVSQPHDRGSRPLRDSTGDGARNQRVIFGEKNMPHVIVKLWPGQCKLGQILIVTAGAGLVQQWGGPVEEIRKGDVVWTPPGIKHWHGATPSMAMTHTALQEQLKGKTVEWMEKIGDEQYNQR